MFRGSGNVIISLVVIAVILGLAGSCASVMSDFGNAQQDAIRIKAEQQALDAERERAVKDRRQGWDDFLWVAQRVIVLVLALAAGAGAIIVGTVYGVRVAATIKADEKTGLFPQLLGRSGGGWAIFDPNRALSAGATLHDGQFAHHIERGFELPQIAVTAGALDVQRAAAQASAYRHAALQSQVPALAPSVEGDHQAAPEINWPHTVPLTGLLKGQGGATLDSIILGMTLAENGQQRVVRDSLTNLSHVGIGGSSGWGKTRACESLLYQIITARERPAVAVIDLKRELSHFNRSERLLWPVATNADDGAAIFHELVKELHKRLELFESVGGCRDLADYNSRRNGSPQLAPICLLADESTMLLKNGDKRLVSGIQELALVGRSAGLLMILSGQSWKVGNTGGSEVRDQLSTRIQFKAMSKTQSRLLIESPEAEGLTDRGRAIAIIPGRERIQLQSPLVSREAIERALTRQTGPRQAMPQVVGVTPEPKKQVAPVTAEQRERIIKLSAQGKTPTAICQEVFPSKSGPRLEAVKQILGV
jgi:hypothetical protein